MLHLRPTPLGGRAAAALFRQPPPQMELNVLGTRFVPGFTVNVEERAALETQMALRATEERLSS